MRQGGGTARLELPEGYPLLNKKEVVNLESSIKCCKTNSCITSKAALLILAWIFLLNTQSGLLYQPSNWLSVISYYADAGEVLRYVAIISYAVNAVILSFYPFAGFLADNKFGRYKTIIWSLRILFISFVITIPLISISVACITVCNRSFALISGIGIMSVVVLIFIPVTAGFIGFNANVIQFGMDQLHDSPANHQSIFIHWYIWTYYFASLVSQIPWQLLLLNRNISAVYIFPVYLVFNLVAIAISLIIGWRRKYWFMIDAARINPYKRVYNVSKFARQHSVPVHRSAFTYCEDEIPTGLDLGKTKYGGPFTTEEVEEVKAFYGIFKVIFSLAPTFFLYFASNPALNWYVHHTYYVPRNIVEVDREYLNLTRHYYNSTYLTYKPYNAEMNMFLQSELYSLLLIVILLPIYLCCLHSTLYHYLPSMLKRIGIGIIFLVTSLISTFVLDTIAHYRQRVRHSCMFANSNRAFIFQDISPLFASRTLSSFSNMFIYIALYEFICAQSPHSMKGFLIGLSFAVKGLAQLLAVVMIFPFSFVASSFPSCGMYYYIMNISVGVLAILLYSCVTRRYRYRQRDEICDIYRYAEEYYSKTQQERPQEI